MAYQGINTGSVPNDGTGDTLQAGAVKINANFTEVYDTLGDSGVIGNAELSQVSYWNYYCIKFCRKFKCK